MCETELEAKYRALAQGRTFLESCLHKNLAEHINSEIGLGTITNMDSAKEWLHSSFLFQRIQQNPQHYAIGKNRDQTWQEKIDEMVMESVKQLKENQLVESLDDGHSTLSSTEYGDIMSKVTRVFLFILQTNPCASQYYIRQSTVSDNALFLLKCTHSAVQMSRILQLPERATLREIVRQTAALRIYLLTLTSLLRFITAGDACGGRRVSHLYVSA